MKPICFLSLFAVLSVASSLGAQTIEIDFDDISGAPCSWSGATPASDEYAALGVTFSGSAPGLGMAIMNECSNPTASGFSPPNFLFSNQTGGSGGTFTGPEILTFATPLSEFQIRAGQSLATTITVTGFNAAGDLVDTMTITATQALQPITISGAGIVVVELAFVGSYCVFDDIVATQGSGGATQYVRGDVNQDGTVDISDVVNLLALLFIPGSTPAGDCPESQDVNSDGGVDISDAVYELATLFIPGSPPPALPFPDCAGLPAPLGCDEFIACP